MRVAVIGATGVLGRNIIPRLIERGYQVNACAPPSPHLEKMGALAGATSIPINILEYESLLSAISGCDAVMHVATAIPKLGTTQSWALNDQIRRIGTTHLLAACNAVGIEKYIQQSIAFLTQAPGSAWLDEETPITPNEITQSATDMEILVKKSQLNWCILRGATLYGPGTGRELFWHQLASEDKLVLPEDGNDYLSLVHVSDLAAAFVSALDTTKKNLLLNVVDNEPITYKELYSYIATQVGMKPLRQDPSSTLPRFRISNQRIKENLSWKPHYASYRTGLAGVF